MDANPALLVEVRDACGALPRVRGRVEDLPRWLLPRLRRRRETMSMPLVRLSGRGAAAGRPPLIGLLLV